LQSAKNANANGSLGVFRRLVAHEGIERAAVLYSSNNACFCYSCTVSCLKLHCCHYHQLLSRKNFIWSTCNKQHQQRFEPYSWETFFTW